MKESSILASNVIFANQLKNGIGEEMEEYLKNPPIIEKKKENFMRFKRKLWQMRENFKMLMRQAK